MTVSRMHIAFSLRNLISRCFVSFGIYLLHTKPKMSNMRLLWILPAILVWLSACDKEACQECSIIQESNEAAVRANLKKVNGGIVYRSEDRPFLEVTGQQFTTCDIDEMTRTESLDNLVELKTFELEGHQIQFQVKWFANCKLTR